MPKKQLHLFWKILFALFLPIVFVLLLCRDYFLPGTILNFGRWIFVFTTICFLYLSIRYHTPPLFPTLLKVCLVALLLEYGWNKTQEASLVDTHFTTELSLMTYNVYFKNRQPAAVIEKIKAANPDILLVQEMTPKWGKELSRAIGKKYPYTKTIPLKGAYGIGIFSKYKLTNYEVLRHKNKLPYAQIVEFSIKKNTVQLINTHLTSPAIAVENPDNFFPLLLENYRMRQQQLAAINNFVDTQQKNIDVQLLVGDLNTMKYEPLFRLLKKDWVNLYDKVGQGWGFTFPRTAKIPPLLSLDYILVKGNAQAMEAKVIQGGSSDHLAVFGKIKI